MAKYKYVYRNKYAWLIALVVLALIIFIWYYLKNSGADKQGEKCPDGRDIPSNGDCGTPIVVKDSNGVIIVKPQVPDANGCITVSKYIPESFPLALGMYGVNVKGLQINLNKYFNAGLKEDGFFGCKTLDAVIKNLGVQSVDTVLFNNSAAWVIPSPPLTLSPNTTG